MRHQNRGDFSRVIQEAIRKETSSNEYTEELTLKNIDVLSLPTEEFQAGLELLNQHLSYQTLTLSFMNAEIPNVWNNDTFKALAPLLQQPTLQRFAFKENLIDSWSGEQIAALGKLIQDSSIEQLDLSWTNFFRMPANNILILAQYLQNSHVTHLDLSHNFVLGLPLKNARISWSQQTIDAFATLIANSQINSINLDCCFLSNWSNGELENLSKAIFSKKKNLRITVDENFPQDKLAYLVSHTCYGKYAKAINEKINAVEQSQLSQRQQRFLKQIKKSFNQTVRNPTQKNLSALVRFAKKLPKKSDKFKKLALLILTFTAIILGTTIFLPVTTPTVVGVGVGTIASGYCFWKNRNFNIAEEQIRKIDTPAIDNPAIAVA